MGVKLNANRFVDFQKISNNENQNKKQSFQAEKEEQNVVNKEIKLKSYEFSSSEILSNYARAGLKVGKTKSSKVNSGHYRYEYKGARFDVYKRDNIYKSQFVYPRDYNTQEFVEKFPELENQPIIQNDTKKSSIETINGEIDETVSQGSTTGDCWLITPVVSMANTEKGKEIIKNSIKVNDDNSVTVSFKGIGVSYTLSQDEIEKYDTDSNTYDSYSNGDNDMLALELAVEKLWKDIDLGKVKLDSTDENITATGGIYGIDGGGLPSQMIYYLTGIEAKEYYYEDARDMSQAQIYKILENALQSDNNILDIGIYDDIHSCTLTDGSTFSLDVGNGGHALAVVGLTSETVTFVNPWDTSTTYTATWAEFASLGIGYISSADLNEAQEKETVYESDSTTDNKTDEYSYGYYNPYSDYNYDYNYNYDYDRKSDKYDSYDKYSEYDYADKRYDDYKPVKPDYNNDESFMPDYDSDYSSYSSTNITKYIIDLLSQFLDLIKSIYSSFSSIR